MGDRRKLANGGRTVVPRPGETADIELAPQRPGRCTMTGADHHWDGMVGNIEIPEIVPGALKTDVRSQDGTEYRVIAS